LANDIKSVLLLAGRIRAQTCAGEILGTARGLARRGIRVGVVAARLGVRPEFRRAEIPAITWSDLARGLPFLISERRLRTLVADARAQLIHVHGQRIGSCGMRLLRATDGPDERVPCVLTAHPGINEKTVPRALHTRAFRVIALNEAMRQDLVNQAHVPKEKVIVIPPGIACAEYAASFPREQQSNLIVGAAGPMEPGAGLDHFIEAARLLSETEGAEGQPAIQFLIMGDGAQAHVLRRLAAERGVASKITFVCDPYDPKAVLRTMDIFVQSSVAEGLGHSLLEAMALGKAVVATDVGGVYSFVRDGETGVLTQKGDAKALADAIRGLATGRPRARRLGRAAREFVRNQFDLDPMVDRILAIYRAALAG